VERKPPGLTFVPKSSWKISRQPGGLLRLGAAGGVVGVVVPVEPPDVARLSDPNLPSAGARPGSAAGALPVLVAALGGSLAGSDPDGRVGEPAQAAIKPSRTPRIGALRSLADI